MTHQPADGETRSDAGNPASLPQLKEVAKSIRLQICAATYAAEGGEWSNTSDEAIDAAINYHLAPLYAELDHAKAENGQLRAANAKFVAETAEKDATIDRLAKLLVECRPSVDACKYSSLYDAMNSDDREFETECRAEVAILDGLLTRIDVEIGGI